MSALMKHHLALLLLMAATTAGAQEEHPHHEHAQPNASEMGQENHAHHASHGDDQRTESERAHVPPPPPQYVMRDMSEAEMADMMAMDDTALFGMMLFDQLEWRDTNGDDDTFAWDGRVWYGNDYDKAFLRTEGDRTNGDYDGSAELLWDHVISRWWSLQAGVAHDFGEGPSRTWAAFGVQGLAPYWFEVEALVYAGEEGRTAASFSAEYEMFLTQRLVLQPKLEFGLYGKDDVANGIGSGFSDAEIGLRLRYEIRREFAPYIGVLWSRKFGDTADLAREQGDDVDDVQFVAGLRTWF